ncbi:hypothetical protein BLA39750_05595 [Burkholderia lata]|uniref:Secreted protein n=1 Tax=Burkholderia lata (strain ATCC 17760 / DSM 23089 / LMG 22485 / NCIMB 9086 / R18194 / 383) TaxID=482957 RepID=A0A6P3AJU1_BURL3|nr:hypothetical protein [Burkholderia lata]VWD44005.1 hypothetical protein BLA39750_05595 [Burkholderia lata]
MLCHLSRRMVPAIGFAAVAVAMSHGQWAAAAPAADSRTLPAVGTTWCYSVGEGRVTPMTLKAVHDGVASYDVGPATAPMKIDEDIATYTTPNPARHGERRLLVFPLKQGKQWEDRFDETVTANIGRGWTWHYRYKAVASSEVIGTEKRQVGAGTYDTFVIVRTTSWTKSDPGTTDATLREMNMHCDQPECTVSGYSKEVSWYAPSIGRVVLRANLQGGFEPSMADGAADESLKNAGSLVTELVGYGDDATCKAAQPSRFATVPSAPGFGFPIWPNNAWEFHMARDIARE